METELGCGVTGHDLSCLCDVVITNPLPPINESIKDGVRDLWMGKELCDLKGYGVPWTRDKILDYLVDLETFYDAYHYSDKLSAESLYEMEPLVFNDDDSPFVRWGMVREVVQYAMDRFNDSLTTIMEYFELTPQFLIDSLTTNKSGGEWNYNKVELLDRMFMAENLTYRDIARTMGMSVNTVNGLRKYWTSRRERLMGGDKPARAMIYKLALETSMSPREITDAVRLKYGKVYQPSTVNKIRSRERLNNGK